MLIAIAAFFATVFGSQLSISPRVRRSLPALPAFLLIGWWSPAFGVDTPQLEALLDEVRTDTRMPGLRAAMRFPDGRIVTAAVGFADRDAEIPLDDHVGMPGGSTGKTFVAALTMLLVEDEVLSLDDPVSDWLGDTEWYHRLPNADDIRVRHLLSHTSGIRDYPGTARFKWAMVRRVLRDGSAYFEPEELIRFVLDKRPLFPAGEGFRYSDAGYLVLGRVIERASGRAYYDLLQERILDPLELTEVRPQDRSVLSGITPGYMGGASNLKKDGRMKFDPRSEWTGGGLVTNPTMLVEFYAALAEGRVVSQESLGAMMSGGWQNPRTPEWQYGYGMFVIERGAAIDHGGLWPGYRTHVTHNLHSGVTIAVQTNRDGRVNLLELIDQIRGLVLESDVPAESESSMSCTESRGPS